MKDFIRFWPNEGAGFTELLIDVCSGELYLDALEGREHFLKISWDCYVIQQENNKLWATQHNKKSL